MANALPIGIRERAVRAYMAGEGTYREIAERFSIGTRTLQEWVALYRKTGSVKPKPKRGGNRSHVDLIVLETVLRERPDAVIDELRSAYNQRVPRRARAHRSSILRALHRRGYVFKKNVPGPQSSTDRTSKKSAGAS